MACPTPNKRKYKTRKEAEHHVATHPHEGKVYYYQCPGCTAWHITSMEPRRVKPRKTLLKYYNRFKKYLK